MRCVRARQWEGRVVRRSDDDGIRGGCGGESQKNTIHVMIGIHIAELFIGADANTGGRHDPLEWCHGDQSFWPSCAPLRCEHVVSTPLRCEHVVVSTPLRCEHVVVSTPLGREHVVVTTPLR